MNKLMIAICLILVGSNLKAQLQKVELPELKKIGVTKYMGVLVAELSYFPTSKDTTYSLLFNNQKYTSITDLVRIDFDGLPGIIDTLYSMLNKGFELANGKQTTFTLGKELIAISSEKAMGAKFIQVTAVEKKAYFYLRKKQLNELFNKSK